MDLLEEEVSFACPYCMEMNQVMVDLSGGAKQQYVYDCSVCCHPIVIKLEVGEDGIENLSAEKE